MNYEFDRMVSREYLPGDMKWDPSFFHSRHPNPIPFWIADMDIPTPEFIFDALRRRMEQPYFTYFNLDERYYNSIIQWQETRNGIHSLTKDQIIYQFGILGAIDTAVEHFTAPADYVLVQSPGYHQFKVCIENHGRKTCPTPLRMIDGVWRMDLEDMEQKITEHGIRLAILCSPHNPTGRVWTREELNGFIEVCYRHHVIVVADEIHSDLLLTDRRFVPTQMVSEHAREITITMASPSKTLNLAGQGSAYSIVINPDLAKDYRKASTMTYYNFQNCMSVEASITAYTQGAEWVDQLRDYIRGNMELVRDSFAQRLPTVGAYVAEATYLMWLDFSGTGLSQDEIKERCIHHAGVLLHDGSIFIQDGVGFMRMNVACPRSYIREGINRLCEEFKEFHR